MTGFPPALVQAIILRDGGLCAMVGTTPQCRGRADTANHRLNRKAGGSRQRNGAGNGCGICNTCNGLIESDAALAEIARHRGVKLREGDDPRLMWSPFFRQWAHVSDDALALTGHTDPHSRPEIPE